MAHQESDSGPAKDVMVLHENRRPIVRTDSGSLTDIMHVDEAQTEIENAEADEYLPAILAINRYKIFECLRERRKGIKDAFRKLRVLDPRLEPDAKRVSRPIMESDHDYAKTALKAHESRIEELRSPEVDIVSFRKHLEIISGAVSTEKKEIKILSERDEDLKFLKVHYFAAESSSTESLATPVEEDRLFYGKVLASLSDGDLQMLIIDVFAKSEEATRKTEIAALVAGACARAGVSNATYEKKLVSMIHASLNNLRDFEIADPFHLRGNGYVENGTTKRAVAVPVKYKRREDFGAALLQHIEPQEDVADSDTEDSQTKEVMNELRKNILRQQTVKPSPIELPSEVAAPSVQTSDQGFESPTKFRGILQLYLVDGGYAEMSGETGNGKRNTELEQHVRKQYAKSENRPVQMYALDLERIQNAFRFMGLNGVEQIRANLKINGVAGPEITIVKNASGEFILTGKKPTELRKFGEAGERWLAKEIAKDPAKYLDFECIRVLHPEADSQIQ